MPNLVWRTYRDFESAPVPVLKQKQARTAYRFISSNEARGDTAIVDAYDTAIGLHTGTIWKSGNTLPSASLAAEPIYLELAVPYGTRTTRLARPYSFTGSGVNPYKTPKIVSVRDEAMLMVPDTGRDLNDEGLYLLSGKWIGYGVVQLIPGFQAIEYITVGGKSYTNEHDYDYYHGTLLLDDVTEGTDVQVGMRGRFTALHPMPEVSNQLTPITHDGVFLGYVTKSRTGTFEDARRLPDKAGGARVGSMYYDGEPVSTGHLWLIEGDVNEETLGAAARKTLPAGSLYRRVDSYEEEIPILISPVGATAVAPITFLWEELPGTLRYHLQIARDSGFKLLEVDATALDTNSYTTSALTAGTIYWRVRAYDGFTMSSWSVVATATASGTALARETFRVQDGSGGYEDFRESGGNTVTVLPE